MSVLTGKQKFGQFLLKLLGKTLPIVLFVCLAVAVLNDKELQQWYFGLLLGFTFSLWASQWLFEHTMERVSSVVLRERQLTIRVLDPREVVPTVRWLYAARNARFYATHIGYRQSDRKEKDAASDDLARNIYTGVDQIPLQRIISVGSQEDRDWVKRMWDQRTNPHYVMRILEEQPSLLPYPNFVIVERDGEKDQLFMSFRGATSDGSGRFAFLTSNEELIRGVKQHFESFANSLPSAEVCINKWSQS